jgi:hypothetical protein
LRRALSENRQRLSLLARDVLRHHPLNAPKPIGWCRMHALLFLAALSSSGGAAPASPPCAPIPGWNAIDQRRDLDFLVIGEMHGSSEIPGSSPMPSA